MSQTYKYFREQCKKNGKNESITLKKEMYYPGLEIPAIGIVLEVDSDGYVLAGEDGTEYIHGFPGFSVPSAFSTYQRQEKIPYQNSTLELKSRRRKDFKERIESVKADSTPFDVPPLEWPTFERSKPVPTAADPRDIPRFFTEGPLITWGSRGRLVPELPE